MPLYFVTIVTLQITPCTQVVLFYVFMSVRLKMDLAVGDCPLILPLIEDNWEN